MKPHVVHQPVQPPQSDAVDADAAVDAESKLRPTSPKTGQPGLVGSYGPLVGASAPADQDGAGADERKAPWVAVFLAGRLAGTSYSWEFAFHPGALNL